MSGDVTPTGRAEEKALLEAWFASTAFDEEFDGLPDLDPEDDDE